MRPTRRWRWWMASLAGAGAAACATVGDLGSDEPGLAIAPARFAGRFLAVSDADMPGTAYADGVLEPLANARDELTLFADGAVRAAEPASNSVISWPQVVDVSSDGRFAAVVETRGPAPKDVATYRSVYTDFSEGTQLSVFAIEADGLRRVDTRDGVASNLGSVEFAADQHRLVIATETEGAELFVAELRPDGAIESLRGFPLPAARLEGDAEKPVRTIHVAPDGVTLAVNVANRRVQFFRLALGPTGRAIGVRPLGRASADLGRRLSVGKWTPDGRHLLVTDTNGGSGPHPLLTRPGAVLAVRPPAGPEDVPALASRARVGGFPEGLDVGPDGTRVATVNLERTFLPELGILSAWPGRRRYSVSLLSLDPQTGALRELDRIREAGILPEDALFDATGENLAVAVFHRRKGPGRKRGFVDFYSIEEGERLVSQGVTQAVTRGTHDLVRVP
jgi:hypothetical protein